MSANGASLPTVNIPTTPTAPTPNTNPMSTFELPKIPEAAVPSAESTTVAISTDAPPPSNAAAMKAPVNPEEGLMAETANSKVGAPGSLPPLEMPALPSTTTIPDVSILPPPMPDLATALPEISVERTKPKVLGWQTRLAPAIIPPRTNFNYRRVQLPESIYTTQYSRDNSHLPMLETREDYQALLFTVVAKNDIDATRALLNAGTGLEITNSYGETPLSVARRSGARDVAQLLVARGAH